MEMRAKEATKEGEDMTPQIIPLASSLSDPFLLSRCSTCFLPLNDSQTEPNICPHCGSLSYCSHDCRVSDSSVHVRSGECYLLRHLPMWRHGDSSTLRLALRLLLLFLSTSRRLDSTSGRINGLLINREKLEGDGEMLESIREGGRAMAFARRLAQDGDCNDVYDGEEEEEEKVLCLVLTNAVEVQVSNGCSVGTAVYGPHFSWFNHSCTPNACYRFALSSSDEPFLEESQFRVFASGEDETLKAWISSEEKLIDGSCRYGPRVTVRNIRSIKKGDEVCVPYTDLLQPKALRQSELWSKYRFICNCNRCTASPPTYVDLCLQENVANLNTAYSSTDKSFYEGDSCEELTNYLDQAIDHVSNRNPKACCEMLEKMLAENFQNLQSKPDEQCISNLQPLHHLSLNAYITLASAYRIRASCVLEHDFGTEDSHRKAFDLSRMAAAHSLLLAGATQYLFSFDSSLIASAAHFWISAGETLLSLVESPIWNPTIKNDSKGDLSSLLSPSSSGSMSMAVNNLKLDTFCYHSEIQGEGATSWDRLHAACKGDFIDCVVRISLKVWPFLIHGLPCLKNIKNPVDFRWLGRTGPCNLWEPQVTILGGVGICSQNVEGCGCGLEAKMCIATEGEERTSVFYLATHCLQYGRYLAGICYGPRTYLTD